MNSSTLLAGRKPVFSLIAAGLALASLPAQSATLRPDQVSGLQLWLEAQSNVDVSGGKVTQWQNLGGSINALGVVDAEPTYLPTGGSNGTPAIGFSGGNRLKADGIQSTTVSELTAFAVVSLANLTANHVIMDDKSLSSNNPGFYLAMRKGSTTSYLEFRTIDIHLRDDPENPLANINHSLTLPSSYDGESIVLMARITSTGTTTLRIGDLAESTVEGSYSLTNIKGTSPFHIGASHNGSWAFDNPISSVVIFNEALSDSDAEGVYNYLYETQVAIPEGKTMSFLGVGLLAWWLTRRVTAAAR